MTPNEVRAVYRAEGTPFGTLLTLVQQGMEYPDAVWAVTSALRLDDEAVAEMVDLYDNAC